MDTKLCSKCMISKDISAFKKSGRWTDTYCSPCRSAYNREWRAKNKERVKIKQQKRYLAKKEEILSYQRDYREKNKDKQALAARKWHLQNKYGLSLEMYESMFQEQDGKCAVCSVASSTLDIDHDHATGKIRGLLCHPCNVALGLVQDNRQTLTDMIAYLGNTI